MSISDIMITNDENAPHSEEHIIKNEVYKNLRRRSSSLAFILTILLPILLFFFNIACTPRRAIVESFHQVYGMLAFDLDCLAIVLGWLLFQSIFFLPIRNKSNMISSSRSHGIISFILSLGSIYILNRLNIIRASYVYDNINKILVISIIVSYFIGLLLFVKGTRTRRLKQIKPIVAFFYGTDINLSIAHLDLKLFFELRIGLIGWACLNLCFLLKTMELYTYRRPPAFVLVVIQQILQAFQLIWYKKDRLIDNNSTKETIGFIHIFDSLCWFPFLWCLPTQYLTLVNYPIKRLYIIGSAVIFIIGMFISRSTHNEQETLKKSCNKKSILFNNRLILLTSNYWSLCRHPYYLGNFLMLLSWALPCDSMSIPWVLPTYYLLLICHKSQSEDLFSH